MSLTVSMPSSDDLLYKDNYTFYGDSLTRDTTSCRPMPVSSTPDRVQRGTRSRWPDIHVVWDALPRSLVSPLTPSLPIASTQMTFSPSPLPVSQVPSLLYLDISPPSQGSGSTPFERQFVGDFFLEWNDTNTQVSPVARRNFPSFALSQSPNVSGTPFELRYPSQDSQDPIGTGRVSLMDRFISAAADESHTTDSDIHFSMSPSEDPSSPLSDLSDLTSLSSSSDDYARDVDLRSSSPPTSPTTERRNSRKSTLRCSDCSSKSERKSLPNHPSRHHHSCSRPSDFQPAKGTAGYKRKRSTQGRDGDEKPTRPKKTRYANTPESPSASASSSVGNLTRRILPANVSYHPQFSLFYLHFPVSSHLRLADGKFPLLSGDFRRPGGIYNEPRDALDLYTPRFVKGCGATKVGVCPICIESPSRGGKGEAVWLSMKFSAYKVVYICRFNWTCQGISSMSGRPFSPPVAFRTTARENAAKSERTSIQEGKCHKCKKWILVESIKNIEIKVKELYWWKHAAACHQGTHIDGDDDFFLEDEIYLRTQQLI